MLIYTFLKDVAFRRMMYFIMVTYPLITVTVCSSIPPARICPAEFQRDNIFTRFLAWFAFDTNNQRLPVHPRHRSFAAMNAAWDTKKFPDPWMAVVSPCPPCADQVFPLCL